MPGALCSHVTDRLFAYGTLLCGQPRWQFLRPFVVDEGQPDTVSGALFDTGQGYPAAVFSPAGHSGRIHGRVFELLADRVDESLVAIDLVEHTADQLYQRVRLQTDGGRSAWAYEYTGSRSFQPIAGGSWLRHLEGT